jgi:tRNA A-37 threonylcarbamoyl transferase component Bud32
MREQPVQVALSRTTVAWLLVALAAGVARRWRHGILGSIDARFFRDRYDASDALRDVSDRLHHVSGVDELVACLTSAIDRALRPWKVTVLLRSESRSHFVSLFGATDPLPSSSLLAELALAASGPLDTAVSGPTSPLRWLPLAERLWLVDSGARLLVPLRASDRTLLGVIALGDRRSGRPYDDGDRQWLHDLARVAAQTLEVHSTTTDDQPGAWRVGLVERHTRANECARCGLVTATDHSTCPDCRSQLDASGVPLVLFGKFQFERRIGRGGQGLVYRATDLSLDRPVAVKTLPGTSPEHAERLRQEARVMAAITHRHLAVIYGMESWRGQPLLLCEFMEQGTLADRLAQAPLTTDAALTLGVELADALSVIHARQLLHRDIKPSNIGYDAAGVPKLLDFGLVHLLSRDTPMVPVLGTPLYMSPEAVAGTPPSHAVDLWSLHVMLYESMAGTHPFKRETTSATVRAIVEDVAPPLAIAGGVSAARAIRLAAYFADALSKNSDRRPATAAAAAAALRALML